MLKAVRKNFRVLVGLIKAQIFLFPRLNTRLLRIHGRVNFRGNRGNLTLGKSIVFLGDAVIECGDTRNTGLVDLGDRVLMEEGCYLNAHGGSIFIEDDVFIGVRSIIQGKGGVVIQRGTLLGPNVQMYSSDHPVAYIPDSPRKIRNEIAERISIGKDVWIGANSIILKGCTISSGSVVVAGSVVKQGPEGAAVIGSRFNLANTIKKN
jgi:maltose O-acetyltransferase